MDESRLRDALRHIHDVVADATGRALPPEAEKRVARILRSVTGAPDADVTGDFLSREVTILLADLRGFTAISANYPAGLVLQLLNQCFIRMSEIIVRHHGTIDKFMGDSIMVIFFGDAGAPGKHVRRALHCAVDMQIAMHEMNRAREAGMPELFLGIGVNTGRVMAGVLGSELYSTYAVIGEDVNLASRIEAFSLRGQVLMTEASYVHCHDFATAGEPMRVYVKGRSERVTVRELLAIPSLQKEVPRQEIRRSPRVEVSLAFDYKLVRDKIVLPAQGRGVILDIGYHGVLAEVLDRNLPPHAELKLDLDLPLVGYRAEDVYARVVKTVRRGARTLYGLEFTSLDSEASANIEMFVQMLIQGSQRPTAASPGGADPA